MPRIKYNMRIKTPPQNLIWKQKDLNGNDVWQFPFNNSYKPSGKDEFIKENYIVKVLNLEPQPNTEYFVSKIIECYPQVAKSKDGRTFLNCVAVIEIDYAENQQNNNNENNYNNASSSNTSSIDSNSKPIENNNIGISDDDLPF